MLALLLAAALTYLADQGRPSVWLLAAGAVLSGELLQVWASAHLHKNVTMVVSGPYSLLRNPMYCGRFLVGLGFALVTWRWYLIAAYAAGFGLYAQARVLGEERRLRGLFGEPYAQYCRTVNRWLPRPPREPLPDRRWSWEAVRRNRQLRVTAGVLAALFLLWCRAHWLSH